jgi:hypothetical protein
MSVITRSGSCPAAAACSSPASPAIAATWKPNRCSSPARPSRVVRRRAAGLKLGDASAQLDLLREQVVELQDILKDDE